MIAARVVLVGLLLVALSPVVAPPAAADPWCEPDYPCDPDPSQFECFQVPKGTLTCVIRIVTDQLP